MNFSKVFNKIADPASRRDTRYGPDTPALYAKLNEFEKYRSRELSIANLNIHSLPPLPDRIKSLYCHGNQVTSLPSLPDGLERLYCGGNRLTSLPELPDRLTYLYCEQNQLTSLPPLPDGLIILECNDNQLTSLPPLPKGLNLLSCNDNQLTSLPQLPDGLTYLGCKNNLNLVNITGKCPYSLRNKSASEVFEGCPNLVPQPVPGETLGAFFDRAAKVNTNTNRNTRSNHLTNVSVGGKTRRYKKRKAKKTRKI